MLQGDISRALEVHRTYISGVESGKCNSNPCDNQKIC
ncbi:MAG: hypothetical protein HY001_05155 [Candidatus Portnoybacteria bacterium]|nr:hypothetical protein [Candidatus Portnoybacteria bacterium]